MFAFLSRYVLVVSVLTATRVLAVTPVEPSTYNVRPFVIDLSTKFSSLKQKIASTRLPDNAAYLVNSGVAGIPLDYLKSIQDRWLHSYNWSAEETRMNSFNHHKVEIEGIDLHYVHEKSSSSDAIPIMFIHGWPGSFYLFLNVIKSLTESTNIGSGKNVSFHVIVPSLPGNVFSSPPPRSNWTIDDTARVLNTLMTEVLGYPQYALYSIDIGASFGWHMYDTYNQTVRGIYFNMLPFYSPTLEQIAAENITLSPIGNFTHARYLHFKDSLFGYFQIQSFQPNQIGFAINDSPMAQFAWVISLISQGFTPGTPNLDDLYITIISLYAMTESLLPSIYTYAQNPHMFGSTYRKARTDAPMLQGNFKYDVGYWPREFAAKAGNLVYSAEHAKGGHFPAIDNPKGLMEDIRQLGNYYKPIAAGWEKISVQPRQELLSAA